MTTTAAVRRHIEAGDESTALNLLARHYEWSGDQMVCRRCKRAIHISRRGEPFTHGTDRRGQACDGRGDANPWAVFLEALQAAVYPLRRAG